MNNIHKAKVESMEWKVATVKLTTFYSSDPQVDHNFSYLRLKNLGCLILQHLQPTFEIKFEHDGSMTLLLFFLEYQKPELNPW